MEPHLAKDKKRKKSYDQFRRWSEDKTAAFTSGGLGLAKEENTYGGLINVRNDFVKRQSIFRAQIRQRHIFLAAYLRQWGDMRFVVYKWLLNPTISKNGNIQVGLGLKLPTGNYHTEDYFYTDANDKSAKELEPVNVAIQLGDGGLGITTEFNAFYNFSKTVSIYGNGFYLISPKNVNGVASWPTGILPPDAIALFHATPYDVNSVPDNYTLRGGANFTFNKLVVLGGLRYEGAPAHDLIGKDDGLRRVGHIFSAEPGLQYKFKKAFLYSFVTLPLARATIETVPDKRMAAITGMNSISPGHFANSLFFVGYTFTF